MANNIHQQVENRVQSFVQEISNLVRVAALEAVAEALGGKAAAGARRGRPPGSKNKAAKLVARPKRAGKRGKRTTEEVAAMGARVLEHVKKNPGTGVEGISKAFKVASKELTLPITRLVKEKKLRTTGQRRGTKYFVK